jgi:hypothetical protein
MPQESHSGRTRRSLTQPSLYPVASPTYTPVNSQTPSRQNSISPERPRLNSFSPERGRKNTLTQLQAAPFYNISPTNTPSNSQYPSRQLVHSPSVSGRLGMSRHAMSRQSSVHQTHLARQVSTKYTSVHFNFNASTPGGYKLWLKKENKKYQNKQQNQNINTEITQACEDGKQNI